MIYAALPLYELGGYRLALLIPMLGGVAGAFAARELARRLSKRDGWRAFWIVGLASPMAIYALDLWEHSLGLALMAWGVVALLDALERRPAWWRALLGGLAFGAAAAMRTEAFAYLFAAAAVICITLLVRTRSLRAPFVVGAMTALGAAVAFGANLLLEIAVLGTTMRAGRATGAAQAGGQDLALRGREAVTMAGGLLGSSGGAADLAMAAGLIGLLAYIAHRAVRGGDQRPAKVAAVIVVLLYLLRITQGLGFVPGLVATTPFAAVGLALCWTRGPDRTVALIAVVALPIVWYTDFTGGVLPQWGGRYILTSGLLLGVLGVVRTERASRWARHLFVGLALGVTVFGLAWMSHRSHEVARAGAWIATRPEPVVVSNVQFWLRESGSYEPDHRWLTVSSSSDLDRAGQIVAGAGFDRFGLLSLAEADGSAADVPGYHEVSQEQQTWLGVPFAYTVYARNST